MGLLSYDPMEDGENASANLWNVRLSAIHDLLNGNIDAANLANNAVTTAKIADGAVTSEKLGFVTYEDANGWTITDIGLVKLATKRRTFTIPSYAQGSGGWTNLDTGMELAPVGFNPAARFNVIHYPYITGLGVNGSSSPWSLTIKEEVTGILVPGSTPVASRLSGGTSPAGVLGACESWVIF